MSEIVDHTVKNRIPITDPQPLADAGPTPYLMVIAGPSFGEMYKVRSGRTVVGRGERVDVRLIDDGASREHAAVEREDGKLVLVDLGSTNGTFCNGARVTRHELADGDKISVGSATILKFTYQDQIDEHYQKQLFESALRDGLTSTFNRRYFMDRLTAEMGFAARHDKSLGLLFVDIDYFKKINDTYGHQAGDAVLSAVARELLRSLRAEDVIARYGGEEFAIICREIEPDGARALSQRLLTAVSGKRFEHAGQAIQVTISIGAAVERSLKEAQALIAAADGAMYEAKRAGRNRVVLHVAR